MNDTKKMEECNMSSGKTSLGLNQWILSDKPVMNDFNEDNRIIDCELDDRVPNRLFAPACAINDVPIADLQSTIDSLPKYLNRSITINTLAGTTTTPIIISNFSGPGTLVINGGAGLHPTTHSIPRIEILSCSNRSIELHRFDITTDNSTAIIANGFIGILWCSGHRIVGGVSSTTANIGISAANINYGIFSNCLISNKHHVLWVNGSSFCEAAGFSGTGNNVLYRAFHGGTIHRRDVGTITGSVVTSVSAGGIVVNPSGAILGT